MTAQESYTEGLIAALQAIPAFPAGIERSMSVAFRREESPMLIIHYGPDGEEDSLDDDVERYFELRFSVLSRNDMPDREALDVMEVAHPVIMLFRAPGIYLITHEGADAPVYASADGNACMVTRRYTIKYTANRLSLSA